jgi:hypothetical protein
VTNEYNFSLSVLDVPSNSVVNTVNGIGIYPYAVTIDPPVAGAVQPPPPVACNSSISATSASYGAGGGSGSVNVNSNCSWSANSNVGWASISSGSSGSGNGTVNYSVNANGGSGPLTGTLTIAGQTFTLNVAGVTACTFTLSANSASLGIGGGNGAVNVNAGSGCGWTAFSDSSWLTVISGGSGNGNGIVTFSASPNTSSGSRTGHLSIGGQTYTITEAGAGFSAIRVNCGGPALTDSAGNAWSADDQSNHSNTVNRINSTDLQGIYQKDSWSTGTLQYQFNIPNGAYTVKLRFAEFYVTQKGQRVMSVVINGANVMSNFDILNYANTNQAFDLTFPVAVTNGQVTIQMVPIVGTAKLNGLEVY